MNPLSAFLLSVAIVVAAKTVAWLIQLRTHNAGVVDAIWSWSLGGLAVVYAATGSAPAGTRLLLALMGGVWGLRLGIHIWRRNWGKPEDFRYANFVASGVRKPISTCSGSSSSRTSSPSRCLLRRSFRSRIALLIRRRSASFSPSRLRFVSVAGEALADAQMEASDAIGQQGTRVPERTLALLAPSIISSSACTDLICAAGAGLRVGLGVARCTAGDGLPADETFRHALLEAEMIKRKPGYAEYVRTTNALIPWPLAHEHH